MLGYPAAHHNACRTRLFDNRFSRAAKALIAALGPECKQTPHARFDGRRSVTGLSTALAPPDASEHVGRGSGAVEGQPVPPSARPPPPALARRAVQDAADAISWPPCPTGGHPHDRSAHPTSRRTPKARRRCPPRTSAPAARQDESQRSLASPPPPAARDHAGPEHRLGGAPALPSLVPLRMSDGALNRNSRRPSCSSPHSGGTP